MDLILALERKFTKINNQLDSNSSADLINRNYNKDLEAIYSEFDSTKEKKYENGLNERRDEILRQLIQKRNEQLEQINEFMQSSQQKSLIQFYTLADSVKVENLEFSRATVSVFESILSIAKLTHPLKLSELVKYANLMSNEERVCLAKLKHLLVLEFCYNLDVHALPSNLIFIYCALKKNMVVLNKSGDLIRLKALQNDCYYDVQVNSTNIVAYNRSNRIVDVYNFKLELIHTIRLERSYDGSKLNNYEIALSGKSDPGQFVIACYNYKTAQPKKKEIWINTDELKRISDFGIDEKRCWFQLVDLNDRFIFIAFYDFRSRFLPNNQIFLLNRHDNNSLVKHFRSEHARWLIYNDQIGSFSPYFLHIYEIDGPVQPEPIKRALSIERMYSTSKCKYIFSSNFNADDFKFEFYHYLLKINK